MRFVIARMNHETNSFSPVPTPLSAFDPSWGEDALSRGRGSTTAMGAFIAYAELAGASFTTPVFAHANPSGPVDDEAWQTMADVIVSAVREGCDAVLLDLHGAMVTRAGRDGEAELLRLVRAAAPQTVIGVALDLHTNLSAAMVNSADALVGFKTYPHIDMIETGEHVVRLVDSMLKSGDRPYKILIHPPLVAHTLQMNTEDPGAMRAAIESARVAESIDGIRAVSVFGGFPLSDIADIGMSVLVIADEKATGERIAQDLASQIWQAREDFVFAEDELSVSLLRAQSLARKPGEGPVILLDHGDNCMSGGTCDTMDVLVQALELGLTGIMAGPISDPAAVATAHEAGVGSIIDVQLGNHLPRPTGHVPPLRIHGRIVSLSDGQYTVTGPTYTGMRCSMGKAAVIDIGSATILISEQPHEPWDLGVFQSVQMDPSLSKFLILKSRMYYRPVFSPIARATVACASPGVTSSDYCLFDFQHIPRPIYPIDCDVTWIPRL